ncbi:MAG: efflux RND transporter periplasmic adaptor subunit, partial [Deltaproteobacteria bacterium]|nr:efflux RND transporter periplasmic adaptor subunit [Deltaproteobacteria bacterium]
MAFKAKYLKMFAGIITCVSIALGLGGCEEKNTYVEPPPPKVTVSKPHVQDVTNYLAFTGNTVAYEEIEIRARVSGFLKSQHFTVGTWVEKGALLFIIDPSEYEANLHAAAAELRAAEAEYKRAEIEFARAQRVFDQGAGAETDVVKWRGEREIAEAAVLRAEAKVERARLDLSYTRVTSPIAGRVSRNLVDTGNLVGESEPTLLTTVTRLDPIYAYFSLNERDFLRVMEEFRERVKEKGVNLTSESASRAEIPLFLGLANEEGFPHEGVADFAESGLDPKTGTLLLRGIFSNPETPPVLRPGLFTRIRMPIDEQKDALLVTERAVGSDQGGRYLLVVNDQNVVEQRYVKIGSKVEGMRVI